MKSMFEEYCQREQATKLSTHTPEPSRHSDGSLKELSKEMKSMFEEYCQREQAAKLSTHTPEPSRRFNSICYDDDDDYDYKESTIPLNDIISQEPTLMQGTDLSQQERHSRLMNEFDQFAAEAGESLTFVYERIYILKTDQYYADIKVMNYIIQDLSQQERHSRLMNEFDQFAAEAGESLTFVYERFSTLVNNIDRNKVKPKEIDINTKFLKSLQPKCGKYFSLTRQYHTLSTDHDKLYDYLSQSEPHVNAYRAKKTTRNHDPLALVANSYANSSYSHTSPS
nr:hypothetical protein [Tanacetum cinerariifolium]